MEISNLTISIGELSMIIEALKRSPALGAESRALLTGLECMRDAALRKNGHGGYQPGRQFTGVSMYLQEDFTAPYLEPSAPLPVAEEE